MKVEKGGKMKKNNLLKGLFMTLMLMVSANLLAQDYAISFDGVDDYATATTTGLGISGDFSIELWVKMPEGISYNSERLLVEYGNGWELGTYQMTSMDSENFKLNFNNRDGTEAQGAADWSDGIWHHLAGTFNSSTKEFNLYFDGNFNANATVAGTPTSIANRYLTIAARHDGSTTSKYSKVTIDEIRIWNTVRSEADISGNMHNELIGTESGLLAYYKMNETSGSTIYDGTSNNNDLTLYGGATVASESGSSVLFSGGSGTSGDPYLISTLGDLKYLSENSGHWNKHFKQTADIDAQYTSGWNSGAGFSPIGNSTTNFTGSYDGQDYTIDNLFINRPATDDIGIGLFGYTKGATIEKLGLLDVYVAGGRYVGGLVGANTDNSTVSNSYSTGSVTGSVHSVGGLVGYNYLNSSTVSNSYSTVSVTGNTYVGGLVGYNYGATVKNSYSRGDVTRTSGTNTYFGGLCGLNRSSTIEYCYSTGDVFEEDGVAWGTDGSLSYDKGFVGGEVAPTTYTNNFFDSEASNQSSDAVGAATALTTAQMQDYNTFTDVTGTTVGLTSAWDFLGTENDDAGTNDYWDMDQDGTVNNGYPILSWQSGADDALPVELSSFTADILEDYVILNWETVTEVNNYGFQVQRQNQKVQSANVWEKIGFVQGHGTTNSPKQYSLIDLDLPSTNKVSYRLKQIDNDGTYAYSKELTVDISTITNVTVGERPTEYALYNNYPNPFNPSTIIKYALVEKSSVKIQIYNILGEVVHEQVNREQAAGYYETSFNASSYSSGVYFYTISATSVNSKESFRDVKKMLFVK